MNAPLPAMAQQPVDSSSRAVRSGLSAQWPILMAIVIHAVVFVLQKDVTLNLEDEGFLWYGVQRVMAGEVPLRDFQSYDIGRYYWYAAWMWVTGSTGILPLRAGSAVLATITVATVVLLLRRAGRQSVLVMGLAVLTFSVWMVPYYKVVDSFAALLLLAGLARLLECYSPRRCFQFGVCLGVAATIGINHALYGVLAGGLALAWSHAVRLRAFEWRWPLVIAAGAVLGYMPMIVFLLAVPGFAAAFIDGIRMLFEIGMTNLDHPLPSPLAMLRDNGVRLTQRLIESAMGVGMWAALGFFAVCAWRGLRDGAVANRRAGSVIVAALLVTLPYAHYAWSRANLMHFAVSIVPLLVAVWAVAPGPGHNTRVLRSLSLSLVSLLSCLIAGSAHPLFQLIRPGPPLQTVLVAGEPLRVTPYTADQLRLLQWATDAFAGGGRAIYVTPYWPGAYAAMARRAPTWEFYQIFPSTLTRQRSELARLVAADIGVALILQHRADNRADLGFDQTHHIIDRYLKRCMQPVQSAEAARMDVLVFVSRGAPCTVP